MRSALVAFGIVGCLALATDALAGTPEDLYERAWEAMDRRDYVEACGLFEQSYAQSGATGPLQGLAACYEARGSYKQALQLWRNAKANLPADSSSRGDVTAAIIRLQTEIPQLTLKLSTAAPPGVQVELDGEVVAASPTPIEVDPVVEHVIEVKASGYMPRRIAFRMAAKEKRTIVLDPGSVLQGPTEPPSIGPIRGIGIGAVALGAVGLTTAIITGAVLVSHSGTIDDGCAGPDNTLCNARALAASEDAQDLAPWNTAAWIVGVAALGAGIPMIIVGDKRTSETAKLRFTGTALSFQTTF